MNMQQAIERNRRRQAELHDEYRAWVAEKLRWFDSQSTFIGYQIPTYSEWLRDLGASLSKKNRS